MTLTEHSELSNAFHKIQTIALRGKLPVVFWDEFDTKLKGEHDNWLKHFLAPMQDSQFQIGGESHFFGRTIFVFAGGTIESSKHFRKKFSENGPENKENKNLDFRTRIKATYDVPTLEFPESAEASVPEKVAIIIQRALIIRDQWLKHFPHIETVDEEVAFRLLTYKYRSGARSIESVIESSTVMIDTNYSAMNLPPKDQLDNHVDLTKPSILSIDSHALRKPFMLLRP